MVIASPKGRNMVAGVKSSIHVVMVGKFQIVVPEVCQYAS